MADNVNIQEEGELIQKDFTAITAWSFENKQLINWPKFAVLHNDDKISF